MVVISLLTFFSLLLLATIDLHTHTHTYGRSAKNVCLLKKEYSSPLFHEHQQGFFLMKICQMSEFFLGWNNFVLSGFQFFYKEMGFNALSEQKKKEKKRNTEQKSIGIVFLEIFVKFSSFYIIFTSWSHRLMMMMMLVVWWSP